MQKNKRADLDLCKVLVKPSSTELLVSRTQTTTWRAVSLRSLSPISRRMKPTPSARSSYVSMKSRERTVWPTSTDWTSHLTSSDLLSANGKPSSRPMSPSRPPMTTSSAFSPLPSPSDDQTRSRRPPMLRALRSVPFVRRWLRSCSARHPAALLPSLLSSSPRLLVAKSRSPPRASTLSRTCV